MALASVHVFRTLPGKLVEHLEATEEAKQRLQSLGLQAFTLQPIAGSDIGGLATVVQYADNRAYTDALQKVQADQGWQEFFARVSSAAIAEPIEVSLFSDTDPTFAPDPNRALGVLQGTQWSPRPGRLMGLMENIAQAKSHIERLGGAVRTMQCMTGRYPMTVNVSVTFEDLDHFGEYGEKLAVDEQFQGYWAGVMADPTAVLVRSGIYQIIT